GHLFGGAQQAAAADLGEEQPKPVSFRAEASWASASVGVKSQAMVQLDLGEGRRSTSSAVGGMTHEGRVRRLRSKRVGARLLHRHQLPLFDFADGFVADREYPLGCPFSAGQADMPRAISN